MRLPLQISKGLALYLGRFFLQPLSHIDVVQLALAIILRVEKVFGISFRFATSLVRRDTASQVSSSWFFKRHLRTEMCATTFEMIQ